MLCALSSPVTEATDGGLETLLWLMARQLLGIDLVVLWAIAVLWAQLGLPEMVE